MENVKVDIWRLSAIVAVSVMFLFSCSRDYISYSREYKVTHSDKPGYFDIIQGKRYRGFIAPWTATDFADMDSVCRFTPSPKEISKAEKIINAKFYDIEDSLRYRFADLDQYWRTYVGRYKDCLAPSGTPKDNKILAITFYWDRIPQHMDQIWHIISEEAIGSFILYVDLNTGHVSIPDFSTSIRPIYLPHLRPSKTKSKNGRIVYEVKEWKPSEK